MAERNLIEQLDQAIDALLAGRPQSAQFDPELASVLVLAADLRDLPDPNFKSSLKGELMPTATMEAIKESVIPYFVVDSAADLIEFLTQTFDAREVARFPAPDGRIMHAAVKVGDSTVEMGEATEYSDRAFGMHVYVDDTDAVYQRALAAGGTSLHPPMDQVYGERSAAVKDRFGNHWYIATWLEGGPVRPGFRTITPFFHPRGADRFLDFLKRAFGATEFDAPFKTPDGLIAHASVKIGGSLVELGETHGEWKPMQMQMHLFVDDCDASYERAVREGARSVEPPADRPYGERNAFVIDPFGNHWYIATPL
ncbi:MAG TPA: VOC family protein [Thermoanaerobaculia bacterium]|nr:VOC family protein [Thermoanaerobaculia bacterium]